MKSPSRTQNRDSKGVETVAGSLGWGSGREAWSLLVISTTINQCVHEGALMQKTNKQTNPNTACAKALRKERPTWVCCNDWWNLASMQMQSEPLS